MRITSVPTNLSPFSGYHPVQMARHFNDTIFVIPSRGEYLVNDLNCYICLIDRVGKRFGLPIQIIRFFALFELLFYLFKHRTGRVFVHSFVFSIPVVFSFTRFVVIFHGSDFRLMDHALFRFFAKRADSCLGVGISARKGGVFVKEIPNVFFPVEQKCESIFGGVPRVLFVLRDAPVKNPDYPYQLFEALKLGGLSPLVLNVVGLQRRNIAQQEFDRDVKGLSEIKSLGRLDLHRLHNEFRSNDVLIVPSHSEGVSKAMLEGFSAGLPVIVDCNLRLPSEFEEYVVRVPLGDFSAVVSKCYNLASAGTSLQAVEFADSYLSKSMRALVEVYSRYYK